MNLLQTLYSEHRATPAATTLAKIQNVISDLNQNLPALLESAHLSNPTLSARIAAAVNLILTTVNSFAALIPQKSPATSQKAHATLPVAKDLKKQWNRKCVHPQGTPLWTRRLHSQYCDKKAVVGRSSSVVGLRSTSHSLASLKASLRKNPAGDSGSRPKTDDQRRTANDATTNDRTQEPKLCLCPSSPSPTSLPA